MKPIMFKTIILLCCVPFGVKSDWPGPIQKIIDTVILSTDEMKQVSAEIFATMFPNCGQLTRTPSQESTPEPGEECDQNEIAEFRKARANPETFDVNGFLERFLESKYGLEMIKFYKTKGVEEREFKAALKETWSSTQSGEQNTTTFGRTFLSLGQEDHKANSWYSYANYQKDCKTTSQVLKNKDGVIIVKATCTGDKLDMLSSFVFPNHPYEDMVIYTMCAWSNGGQCKLTVPGEVVVTVKVSYGTGEDQNTYLVSAHPTF